MMMAVSTDARTALQIECDESKKKAALLAGELERLKASSRVLKDKVTEQADVIRENDRLLQVS